MLIDSTCQKDYAGLYSHQQFTIIIIFRLSNLMENIPWSFFLCHYIPNAPVKRTFILEPLISKLCCLHLSTRFPFFLGEREVPRHTIHIPSTPLPSLDRGFSAPCLGLRRVAQGPWLREHKGKMGSFAFSLLGQYPKNDCTVDF